MAGILDYSTTPGSNTTINGIGIAGSSSIKNGDDALRQMMADTASAITKVVDKTAGTYSAVKADHNQLWRATGTVTINLAAAATLTEGWCLVVQADGGNVTVDPAGSEQINGAATLSVISGTVSVIICTGTAFRSYQSFDDTLLGGAAFLDVGTTAGTVAAGPASTDLFIKAAPREVAFVKTGAFAVSIKAGTIIEVGGEIYTFSSATAVTMPESPAVGDYAIWIKPDGTLHATTDFTSPPVANSRKIGGFHYAPGGNASGYNSGGDTTPQINEYSFWDIKFRPACPDPQGMVLVAGSFWCDIYLLGVDHHVNGTSRAGVTIADGSSPPKVPAAFGGNGSTVYGSLNWWEAAEVMQSHGKDLLSYAEFAAAAYGVKEAQSGGTDPVSTILRADYTSKWGVMLATGNLYVWSRDFSYRSDGTTSFAWAAITGGRGSVYKQGTYGLVAARFGGGWDAEADSGSRASHWRDLPSLSSGLVGARGRSDHLNYE